MLDAPEKDEDGVVVPHDHAQIFNEDVILKRVSQQHLVEVSDGQYRLSTAIFSQSSDKYRGSSINILKIIEDLGEDVEAYCRERGKIVGAIALSAGAIRGEDGLVGFEPLDDDLAHGEIWNIKGKPKLRRLLKLVNVQFCDFEVVQEADDPDGGE
jgi:hypothetical protein